MMDEFYLPSKVELFTLDAPTMTFNIILFYRIQQESNKQKQDYINLDHLDSYIYIYIRSKSSWVVGFTCM